LHQYNFFASHIEPITSYNLQVRKWQISGTLGKVHRHIDNIFGGKSGVESLMVVWHAGNSQRRILKCRIIISENNIYHIAVISRRKILKFTINCPKADDHQWFYAWFTPKKIIKVLRAFSSVQSIYLAALEALSPLTGAKKENYRYD